MAFFSKWFRNEAAHKIVRDAEARRTLKRTCRIEKLQDRRPMAADIHLGAVYYEPDNGLDTAPNKIDVSWTGGPTGAEVTTLKIDFDKNSNGVIDPGEAFVDSAAGGLGVFGNSPVQFTASGFTILNVTALGPTATPGSMDGATGFQFTLSGFTVGKHLIISADVDELQSATSQNALVEGKEFEGSLLSATFKAPHYMNVSGGAVFFDNFSDALADQAGVPRDDYNLPPDPKQPVRTAGAFVDLTPTPLSTLAGRVHAETDNNLAADAGEKRLQGVTIQLLDAGGNVIDTTLTDANGEYKFIDLQPGTYGVREIQPTAYFQEGNVVGKVGATTVGSLGPTDVIQGIVLPPGGHGVEYNFVETYGSISGQVRLDVDGLCDDPNHPEPGIAGVKIELLDGTGAVIATTTTDKDGNYRFDKLTRGEYSVRETQPTEYFDEDAHVGTVGGVASGTAGINLLSGIQLTSARDGIHYNFCEELGKISGQVRLDVDGLCDDPNHFEPGIAGVKIELLDDKGAVLATTTTDANGNYSFDGLKRGIYSVRETQPAAYFDEDAHVGTIGGVAVGTSGLNRIDDIALLASNEGIHYNFCEELGSISGQVRYDADGLCDDPNHFEPGIAGVTIQLLDAKGAVIATTTTDVDGNYFFGGLQKGVYSVREIQPAAYFDEDAHVGTVGGIAVGTAGVNRIDAIQLTDHAKGIHYNFCEELGSIRGKVQVDVDGLCDDPNHFEPGIAGVTLTLFDVNGKVVATTVTDKDGLYAFENLSPGTYTVRETQPGGYFDEDAHVGTVGGAASGVSGINEISTIQLVGATDGINYNFCENLPAQLSGVVFKDGPTITFNPLNQTVADILNDLPNLRDGQLTSDDTPIAGVTIMLFRTDGQPIIDVNGNLVTRTVTDAAGRYQFTGLEAGNYFVVEVHPNGYYDSFDTPGSTGGFSFEPDFLMFINLDWRDNSVQNNFSEVQIEPRIFVVPPDSPPPPPPVVVSLPYVPPTPIFAAPAPQVFALPPALQSSTGPAGYTWHLSVVNGGKPRAPRMTKSQMVARARELAELGDERPDWNSELLRHGQFVMRTGEDDQSVEREVTFGVENGTPVVGDFNGDGTTDVGVFREGRWFVDLNGNGAWDEGDMWAKLGHKNDLPITGDWDGDGKTDIAIFGREWPGDTQHIAAEPGLPSDENEKHEKMKNVPPEEREATLGIRALQVGTNGTMRSDLIDHVFRYGWSGDRPIAGDWTGEGQEMVGIFRDGQWILDLNGDGQYDEHDKVIAMGQPGDRPVIGDFNGDTRTDLGIYRDGLWQIDTNNDGLLDARDRAFTFGKSGELPVVGDWDGDGIDDPGLYRQTPQSK